MEKNWKDGDRAVSHPLHTQRQAGIPTERSIRLHRQNNLPIPSTRGTWRQRFAKAWQKSIFGLNLNLDLEEV